MGKLAMCGAGELTCLHLMQIGWTAVEAAARRQDFIQQADIIDAMAQKFGQPCQVCKFCSL